MYALCIWKKSLHIKLMSIYWVLYTYQFWCSIMTIKLLLFRLVSVRCCIVTFELVAHWIETERKRILSVYYVGISRNSATVIYLWRVNVSFHYLFIVIIINTWFTWVLWDFFPDIIFHYAVIIIFMTHIIEVWIFLYLAYCSLNLLSFLTK